MSGIVLHKYQRMDKGQTRRKSGPKPSSPRRKNGQFINVLPNDPESIKAALESYRSGATLEAIATHYGVTKQAIYGWLLGDLGGDKHSYIVTQALTSRIASSDDRLETADNPLDLARAREMCRNSRLDFERRRPHLYGPKQEITTNIQPVMNIQIITGTPAQAPVIAPQQQDYCGTATRIEGE